MVGQTCPTGGVMKGAGGECPHTFVCYKMSCLQMKSVAKVRIETLMTYHRPLHVFIFLQYICAMKCLSHLAIDRFYA